MLCTIAYMLFFGVRDMSDTCVGLLFTEWNLYGTALARHIVQANVSARRS